MDGASALIRAAWLLRAAIEPVGACFWWSRDDGLHLSPVSGRMFGLRHPGEIGPYEFTCERWEDFVFPMDLPLVHAAFGGRAGSGKTSIEFRALNLATGRESRVHACGRVVRDHVSQAVLGHLGFFVDVTARGQIESLLRFSEEGLRLSEQALPTEAGSSDSRRSTAMAGHPSPIRQAEPVADTTDHELPSIDLRCAIHADDIPRMEEEIHACLTGVVASCEGEFRLRRADGTYVRMFACARVVDADDNSLPTPPAAALRAEQSTPYDDLTNLPDRRFFSWRLKRAMSTLGPADPCLLVLSIDLDGFKAINNTLGRAIGDRVLQAVADRLRAVTRADNTVARLGGDEFILLIRDRDGVDCDEAVARQVINAFSHPVQVGKTALEVSISIGAVRVCRTMGDVEEVLRQAEIARHEAKEAGGNTIHWCTPELVARHERRNRISLSMRESMRHGHFHLEYQPLIDVRTGGIASFEALMRWNHPELGRVDPGTFIPIAEKTGLIVRLGAWALAEACREAARWPGEVGLAVNVSAVQFDGSLEDIVLMALDKAQLSPDRLKLEVTESVLMCRPDAALAALRRLQGVGIRVALDDFGTGFSSLSYLRRFPFNTIKIDRTFVESIGEHETGAIVRSIVELGERLGMGIVAEGIETPEQAAVLKQEGCTELQGYFYSPPLKPDAAQDFIQRWRSEQ